MPNRRDNDGRSSNSSKFAKADENKSAAESTVIRQSYRQFRSSLSTQREQTTSSDNFQTPKLKQSFEITTSSNDYNKTKRQQTPVICAIAKFDEDDDDSDGCTKTKNQNTASIIMNSPAFGRSKASSVTTSSDCHVSSNTDVISAIAIRSVNMQTQRHIRPARQTSISSLKELSQPPMPEQPQTLLQPQAETSRGKSLAARARDLFRPRSSSRSSRTSVIHVDEVAKGTETQPPSVATASNHLNSKQSVRAVKSKSSTKLTNAKRSSSVVAFNGSGSEQPIDTGTNFPSSIRRSSSISRSISSLFGSVRRRSRSRSGDISSEAAKRHTIWSNGSTVGRIAGVYQSGSRSPSPSTTLHSRVSQSATLPSKLTYPLAAYKSAQKQPAMPTADALRVAAAFANLNSPFAYARNIDAEQLASTDLDSSFELLESLVRSRPKRVNALNKTINADLADFGVTNDRDLTTKSVSVPPNYVRVWLRTARRSTPQLHRSNSMRRSMSHYGRQSSSPSFVNYAADACPVITSSAASNAFPLPPVFGGNLVQSSMFGTAEYQANFSSSSMQTDVNEIGSNVYVNINVNQAPRVDRSVTLPAETSAVTELPSSTSATDTVVSNQASFVPGSSLDADNRYSTATVLSGCSSGTTDSAIEIGYSANNSDRESRPISRNGSTSKTANASVNTITTPVLESVSEKRNEPPAPIIINVVRVVSDSTKNSKPKSNETQVASNSCSDTLEQPKSIEIKNNSEKSAHNESAIIDSHTKKGTRKQGNGFFRNSKYGLIDDLASVNSLDEDGFYTSMTNYSIGQSLVSLGPAKSKAQSETAEISQKPPVVPHTNMSVEIIEMSMNAELAASSSTPQLTPRAMDAITGDPFSPSSAQSDYAESNMSLTQIHPPVQDAYKLCVLTSVSSFDDESTRERNHLMSASQSQPLIQAQRQSEISTLSSPFTNSACTGNQPHSILKRSKKHESIKPLHVSSASINETQLEKVNKFDKSRSVSSVPLNTENNLLMQPKPQLSLNDAEVAAGSWPSPPKAVPRSVSFANSHQSSLNPPGDFERYQHNERNCNCSNVCTGIGDHDRKKFHHLSSCCAVSCHAVSQCCHLKRCCALTLSQQHVDCHQLMMPASCAISTRQNPCSMLSDTCSDQFCHLPTCARQIYVDPLHCCSAVSNQNGSSNRTCSQQLHESKQRRAQRIRVRTSPATSKRALASSQPVVYANPAAAMREVHTTRKSSKRSPVQPVNNLDNLNSSVSGDDVQTDAAVLASDASAQLGKLVSRLAAVQVCEPGSPVCSNYRKLYSLSATAATQNNSSIPQQQQTTTQTTSHAHDQSDSLVVESFNSTDSNVQSDASQLQVAASTKTIGRTVCNGIEKETSDFDYDSLDDETEGDSAFSKRQRSYRFAVHHAE